MKKNYMRLIVALLFATNLMAQNIPNYVPTNGLVGWWPFNGNANDESGNGNHGTVNGATLTSDRNGKPNSAYNFDGVSNVISTKLNNYSKNLSISIWVKVEKNKFSYPLGLGLNQQVGGYGLGFSSISGECQLQRESFFVFDGYKSCQNVIQTESIKEINKWENIIFIIENNSIKLYKNNKYEGSNDNFIFTGINMLQFGRRNDNIFPFGGQIDDIAIFNRALTELEVKQLNDGCTKETAASSSFNSYVFTNNVPINLSATPIEGSFSGDGIVNNTFNPTKALLGKNKIKYNFKNTSGCADSTDFFMIMVDTVGNVCKKTVNDTVSILKIQFQLTTGIKANTITNISVYPNPTSDVLIIDAIDSQALAGYTYRILDIQGKQIYNATVTSSKTEIALKTLGAKGVYVLHIVDANGISIENKKIVMQ